MAICSFPPRFGVTHGMRHPFFPFIAWASLIGAVFLCFLEAFFHFHGVHWLLPWGMRRFRFSIPRVLSGGGSSSEGFLHSSLSVGQWAGVSTISSFSRFSIIPDCAYPTEIYICTPYRNSIRLSPPKQHPLDGPIALVYKSISVVRFYMRGREINNAPLEVIEEREELLV